MNSHSTEKLSKLLLEAEGASFFQSIEYVHFLAGQKEVDLFQFLAYECPHVTAAGYVIAEKGFLKRLFTARAIIHGGLIIDPLQCSDEELLLYLTQLIRRVKATGAIYLEIRNYSSYSNWMNVFTTAGFQYQAHLTVHLPLRGIQQVYGGLSESRRRQLKIAQKSGARYYKSKAPEDMRHFYMILQQLYKNKIKKPLFSVEFFEQLLQLDSCHFFVVLVQDKVIGGSVCVSYNNRIMYEWYVCGLDSEFPRCYPSVLATWAGIEYASLNNFELFDMMGAGKPGLPYGVRDFKLRFGGELVEYGRFVYVFRPFKYAFGKLVMSLRTLIGRSATMLFGNARFVR